MKDKITRYIEEISGLTGLELSYPENKAFGHYSTNIAFRSAKAEGKDPSAVAENIAQKIAAADREGIFAKVAAAPPGFINFWISDQYLYSELRAVLVSKGRYGRARPGEKKEKIQVEFISANPTGPLTMANGRGGFLGDVLARVLEFAGYKVTREYFVNDAGNQIKNLGASILAELNYILWDEKYYKGGYITDLAESLSRRPELAAISKVGYLGRSREDERKIESLKEDLGRIAAEKLLKSIKRSVARVGIKFDAWTSEYKDIRKKKLVEKTLVELAAKGLVSEHDDALWLKKEVAGEKERVLRKSGGEYTYYAIDLSYHRAKFRKFDRVINLWGADHHGNVQPLKEGLRLLGIDPERLRIIMFQLVRLVRGGKEVKMSKRAGEFVTLDDLLSEVGKDAVRFFFLMVSPHTHMDFDLLLAKERSMKNPVYYVQYAYVRTLGILGKFKAKEGEPDWALLASEEDRNFAFELLKFPDVVREAAEDLDVSRLARYSFELSRLFHNFYEKERIVGEKEDVAKARAALVSAAKVIFTETFDLLGIEKPKKM